MRNDDQPIAHFITRVAGVNGFSEPIEIQIIISQAAELEAAIMQNKSVVPDYEAKSTPYVHSMTTSLSEANKRGLDNLAYWRNGFRGSKVYILNQALAQYLAQYQESQQAIPTDEV